MTAQTHLAHLPPIDLGARFVTTTGTPSRPVPLTLTATLGDITQDELDAHRLRDEIRFLADVCPFANASELAALAAAWLLIEPSEDVPRAKPSRVAVRVAGEGGSVDVARDRRDMHFTVEEKEWGAVDIVFEGKAFGAYRLRVASGRAIPTHVHRIMRESELVLSDGMLLQRMPARAGHRSHWPHGYAHRYDNLTHIERAILCVDLPRFIPDDEIEMPDVKVLPMDDEAQSTLEGGIGEGERRISGVYGVPTILQGKK